jgi:hypothetical protein
MGNLEGCRVEDGCMVRPSFSALLDRAGRRTVLLMLALMLAPITGPEADFLRASPLALSCFFFRSSRMASRTWCDTMRHHAMNYN